MFCTSVVFAYVTPSLAKAKLILSEGFESGVTNTAPGLPQQASLWGGDEAIVVAASPEVKPRSGRKMLRFLSASYAGENSPRSRWGDVYRVVDVRGMAGTGRSVVRLSASFAQDFLPADAQFSCSVEAFAIDQDLNRLPSPLTHAWLRQNNSASGSRRQALAVPHEWQEVSVEVPITSETRSVLLHLAVMQDSPSIQSGVVQFPGHYVDDVKVEFLSRP
jgi:hypothetical protein